MDCLYSEGRGWGAARRGGAGWYDQVHGIAFDYACILPQLGRAG